MRHARSHGLPPKSLLELWHPAFVFSLCSIALSILVGLASEPAKPQDGTSAAAAGGTTSVLEPTESPPTLLVPVLHTAGVLVGMRTSLSLLWPDYFNPLRLEENGRNFRLAWTSLPKYDRRRPLFESDGDPWLVNIVGHGLFGSEIYHRMRRCGHGPVAAFSAAVIASSSWEYGVEAFHQRPSAIDLAWTPIGAVLIGEGRHQLFRLLERLGPGAAVLRRAGMIILDPLGEAEAALFGVCRAR